MKKIITITLSLVCIGLVSFAQNNTDRKPRTLKGDLNGDGKISRAEFNKKAAQQVKQIDLRADKTFDRMDANQDGFLDRDEMRQARMRRQGARNQRGNRKGGMRNPGQRNQRGQQQGRKKKKQRSNKRFLQADRNGDKQISFREFKRQAKQKPNYSRRRARNLFDRIDRNQDNRLSPRELNNTKRKVINRRRGRNRR